MSTIHVRVPPSAFTSSRRRKHSFKAYSTVPPSKTRSPQTDDSFVPRAMPNASIAYLREALNTLDSKMASLMNQRRELEAHLEQAVRMQSPVLRLPSELLSTIFIIGVLGMGDEDPVMVPTLMLVCRTWADVALNTPTLWAKISVSAHDSLEKARRRLERSKSSPLDITVNFGPRTDFTNNSVMEQVIHAMDLFRPALWRTRSFQLSVPSRPQAHAALMRCQEEAPLLEILSIHVYHSMMEDHYSTPPLPLFKGNVPRLRSCSLTSFNFAWDLRLVTNLRILKLGGYFNSFAPSSKTVLDILRQCPDLEELVLRNLSDVDSDPCLSTPCDFDAPLTVKSIHLPRLTKVSFYYAGSSLARQIMSQITFSSLESLELCYLENVTSILHMLYTQGLTRLPLRSLRIESCLFNEMKFLNLLRRLPSLVTLELVDIEDVSSNFLKGLSSSQPWVCPRLDSLTLEGCTALDWDSLRTFVEARLPSNPHSYARYHSDTTSITSSASTAAAAHARFKVTKVHQFNQPQGLLGPHRLRAIDVTRCNQISKEMVQWLRMYISEVKCEPAKGVWGENIMP